MRFRIIDVPAAEFVAIVRCWPAPLVGFPVYRCQKRLFPLPHTRLMIKQDEHGAYFELGDPAPGEEDLKPPKIVSPHTTMPW